MNKFRLLNADEIECRISMIKENGLSLLLYKTARTDANLLDETVGEFNWQNDFKLVDGVLYGGIGIFDGHDDFIWKWDAGTESNTEAEKGRASDAFKRAGFKWGIGRELYTAPFIWITADKCEIKNGKCYDKFYVSEIGYNEKQEIVSLSIFNEKRDSCVYRLGSGNNTTKKEKEQEAPQATATIVDSVLRELQCDEDGDYIICADCGEKIRDQKKKDGSTYRVTDYVAACMRAYGRPVCSRCRKNGKAS